MSEQLEERADIDERLRAHIESLCLTDGERPSIGLDDELLKDGLIDSMGVMELVAFMEETFGVSVDDLEIVPDNFRSVRAVANLLKSKL